MKILAGHTTPETAYIVEDYPYGFRLRCKIRYWLEYVPKKGFRLWSQTTNPKQGNGWTNKPKASTFQRFAGCMFLNEEGHVAWTGLTEYDDVKTCVQWRETYGHTMPQPSQDFLKLWITKKLAFEQAKIEGTVKMTMTTTKYGSITSPGFGKPIEAPIVETHVLTSKHSPEELAAMGSTLRTPITQGLKQL